MTRRSAADVVRTLYQDLVARRTVVRMSAPIEPSLSSSPVFLVGPYRSGTTMVRLVLDSHSRLAVPPETFFMAELRHLVDNANSHQGFEGLGFSRQQVVARAAEFTAYFMEAYSHSRGKQMWVDKSPEYVWHLDWLAELFPSARFLLLSRHALDQVHSHVSGRHVLDARLAPHRESPQEDARIAAARYWAAATEAQLAFLEHHENAMLLRYEDACAGPIDCFTRVANFIGVPFEAEMLEYWQTTHDFGLEDDRARRMRSLSLSTGGYLQWPASVRSEVELIVAPTLRRVGWSEGSLPAPGIGCS